MKNEKEVNNLLQRLYGQIGGDPASITTVRPLYGGWHNALRYEVSRADGATTMIEREDILQSNEAALTDALKQFALQHRDARPSAPRSDEAAQASASGVIPVCTCGYRPAVNARFCSRCGRDLHSAPPAPAPGPMGSRRRAVIVAIAIACVAGTVSYWLASRNLTREDGASRVPDSRAEKTTPDAIQRLAFEQPAPPNSVARQLAHSTPHAAENYDTNAFSASAPAAREIAPPAPQRAAAYGTQPDRRADSRRRNARASSRPADAARPRSVDAIFIEHANAQCRGGIGGFVCRERLRFSLCKSRWTDAEVAGMTICHVAGRGRPPS